MEVHHWFSGALVTGPVECRIPDASSHIVDLTRKLESRSGAQHSVLYFFCSAAPTEVPISITFVSTIVHQLVCCLPQLKEKVTNIFLYSLLNTILREEPLSNLELSRFNENDSAEVAVEKILEASSDGYWGALGKVMDIDREQGLSLIIDGLDKAEHRKYEFIREVCVFVEQLRGRHSSTRVLLTSRPQAEIKELLSGLPCIEYDKERRGLISLIYYSLDKHGS
jgi:hypothetical protein